MIKAGIFLLLSSLTNGLEVESHQLTAGVPEELRVVVRWIHSSAFRVDPAQLQLVVSKEGWLGKIQPLTKMLICIHLQTDCYHKVL